MQIKRKILGSIIAGLAGAFWLGPVVQAAELNAPSTQYEMVFVPTWTSASHPHEYPTEEGREGHFSALIGATHKANYYIFKEGTQPTPGLENLSEHGKLTPLDNEIEAAIKAGKAGVLIKTDNPIKGPVHQLVTITFKISKEFPLVSIVAMTAPSPDWFVGIANVNLYKNGRWVPTVTKTAYAWDSGGDKGQTYYAEDQDTSPKEKTKAALTKHFVQNKKRVPVGVFVFTRIPSDEATTDSDADTDTNN